MNKCDSDTVESWAGGYGKEWGKAVAKSGTSTKSMLANDEMPESIGGYAHKPETSQRSDSQP